MTDVWANFRKAPEKSEKPDPWAAFRAPPPAAELPRQDAPPPESYPDAAGNFPGSNMAGVKTENLAGTAKRVDDAVRLLANGMSFGQADRIAGYMSGNGTPAEALRTQKIREERPIESAVTEALGGLVTGTGLMKNGVTLVGRGSQALVPRVGKMAVEGAAYGAAQGAGNVYGDKPQDYVDAAKEGAKMGALVGGGLPVVGSVMGKGYELIRNFGTKPVDGMSRTASGLLRTAAAADEAGIRAMTDDAAMLPDAGPAMLGLARGAATRNAAPQSDLITTLRARDAATPMRLEEAANRNLGPAPTPSIIERGLKESRDIVGKAYDPVLDKAAAVDTKPLADQLDALAVNLRGDARKAVVDVRKMLDIPGNPGVLDPHPRALKATREAIDDMLENAKGSSLIRHLTIARQAVDEELARAAPGIKQVDAPFQELKRQSEGLQRGGQIFDTGKTAIRPGELADELQAGAVPRGEMIGPSGEAFRVKQAARADIDRTVGTQANDLRALENKLGTPSDWNYRKASQTFGDDEFGRFMKAVADERTRRESMQQITQNSKTAATQASEGTMKPGASSGETNTTMLGALKGLSGAGFRLLAGLARANTQDEIASVMSKQGADAKAIGELLLLQRNATGETAKILNRVFGAPEAIGATAPVLDDLRPAR